MGAARLAGDAALAACAGTGERLGVAIEQHVPVAALRYADPIALARHRGEIVYRQQRWLAGRVAQPGVDTVRLVVADQPFEAERLAVARMQCGSSRYSRLRAATRSCTP